MPEFRWCLENSTNVMEPSGFSSFGLSRMKKLCPSACSCLWLELLQRKQNFVLIDIVSRGFESQNYPDSELVANRKNSNV